LESVFQPPNGNQLQQLMQNSEPGQFEDAEESDEDNESAEGNQNDDPMEQ
jgi:hypothetical protein